MRTRRTLHVQMAPALLDLFFPLFREGVEVEIEVGCTIQQLLTDQFGISPDYIAGRITTIFLNSRAVDDADKAVVGDGAVLALSGAMPGLVGATMRSGGYYAAMRGAMTHRNEERNAASGSGTIRMKLFNLLLEELGPLMLRHGILLAAVRWNEFLEQHSDRIGCRVREIDGLPVPEGQLRREGLPLQGEIFHITGLFGDD